jgi:hypothetical protein
VAVGAGCASNNNATFDEQTEVASGGQCKAEVSSNDCSQCCTAIDPDAATLLGKRLKSCENQNSPGFLDWSKIINQLVDAGANALKGVLNKWASGASGSSKPSTGGTPAGNETPDTKPETKPGETPGLGTGTTDPAKPDTKPETPAGGQPGEEAQGFAGPTCVSDVKEACRKDAKCKAVLDCLDGAECRSK